MVEKGRKKIGSIIYLITGAVAILLGAVDLVAREFLEAALPSSWGVLFVFLGFKERLDSKSGSKHIKAIHFLLLIIVIGVTLAVLIYRLKKL